MQLQKPLKTRFAPSPTGNLHIGGARTALFNYLISKKTGGSFVLRIEDTDTDRNVPFADINIIKDLEWLGIHWDEGVGIGGPNEPYYQTQRMDIYRKVIDSLLESGNAYYAFDTNEELDAMRKECESNKTTFKYTRPKLFPDSKDVKKAISNGRPVVVRFKSPCVDVVVQDLVSGQVTIPASELDDFVIQKNDGMPTYHLANVIDDSLMGINFVMRGQEFLAQTHKHILLQRALNYDTPQYAHLPLIMDKKGKKLSKRDGDVEVMAFRNNGYLPDAITNFIALLGWSPGNNIEKMSMSEMIELFSIDRIGQSNAKFDRDKLISFNTYWMNSSEQEKILSAFNKYIYSSKSIMESSSNELRSKLLEINKGFRTFADIDAKSSFLFTNDEEINYDYAVEQLKSKNAFMFLNTTLKLLSDTNWYKDDLEVTIQLACKETQTDIKDGFQAIRIAISGKMISPPIYESLVLLGKEKTLNRMKICLEKNYGK